VLLARGPAMGLASLAGFAPWLPADLWFFLAQRGSRVGQFPTFAWAPALARLGQYGAANIVGGLPLYAGAARHVVAAGLGAGLLGLGGLVAWRWRGIGGRWLLGLCALAPAVGLLGLGVVFDNTPIELRYLSFSTPFVALLLAGALAGRPVAFGLLLAVQAAGIAGLLTRAETMQPQAATAGAAAALAGADGLVLLARGNDGVGLVGSVLLSAPAETRLHLVTPETTPTGLREVARGFPRLALILLAPDAASAAEIQVMQAAFADDPCWRDSPAPANLRAYDNLCRG